VSAFRRTDEKRALSTESSFLIGLILAGFGLPIATLIIGTQIEIAWFFEVPGSGSIYSSPAVDKDCVYFATAHGGKPSGYGVVYCLDRLSGKQHWAFDDDRKVKPVFSSPCIADGRLYIGEGFHQDSSCKLYCLDVTTGRKLWDFVTSGHTESSPSVAEGLVYFGAGDDGLYCLDGLTGKEKWHFQGPHVDSKPALADGCVFAGSGYGKTEVFCLNAMTGQPRWRVPVDLPSFGSPTFDDQRVYFGIGNGSFLASDPTPAGALLCLDSRTGKEVWSYRTPDAILAQPVVCGQCIYIACRDGCCYCLDRAFGDIRWRQYLGRAIVANPAIVNPRQKAGRTGIGILTSGGLISCLDARDGQIVWKLEIAEYAEDVPCLISSPVISEELLARQRRRVYFGTGMRGIAGKCLFYCLEENAPN
jgi:outer membrane protein assembly factor BamB